MGEKGEREQRQARLMSLLQDTVSEMSRGISTKFDILMKGNEDALGQLATEYELEPEELVFASDALLAVKGVVNNLHGFRIY